MRRQTHGCLYMPRMQFNMVWENSTENCGYRCCGNQHNYDSKMLLWALMASLCNRKYIPIHWCNSHYRHGAITWWQQMYRSCPHMLFMPSQAVMWHLHLVGEESVRTGLHGKTLKILQLLCESWLITFYRWRNEFSSHYWDTYEIMYELWKQCQ